MAYSDARKEPWYHDLTPSEMETCIGMVPALLGVAKVAAALPLNPADLGHALGALDAQHPDWQTWLTVEQRGR